jgi:H+-transporting ATPase
MTRPKQPCPGSPPVTKISQTPSWAASPAIGVLVIPINIRRPFPKTEIHALQLKAGPFYIGPRSLQVALITIENMQLNSEYQAHRQQPYLGRVFRGRILCQLNTRGHAFQPRTIFVMRTRGPLGSIHPAPLRRWSAIVSKIIATLAAVYGWLMTPIGWHWALLIWGYALAWFFLKRLDQTWCLSTLLIRIQEFLSEVLLHMEILCGLRPVDLVEDECIRVVLSGGQVKGFHARLPPYQWQVLAGGLDKLGAAPRLNSCFDQHDDFFVRHFGRLLSALIY